MDSWTSKFGVLAFVSIFFNLLCSIPEAMAQPATTTSLVRQVLWSHIVLTLEDPICWSTPVQYEAENQKAFELLVGFTMSFRESSSKLQDMIDSMVVGAALRLAFWFREDELMHMIEYRRYPFSCSDAPMLRCSPSVIGECELVGDPDSIQRGDEVPAVSNLCLYCKSGRCIPLPERSRVYDREGIGEASHPHNQPANDERSKPKSCEV